MTNPIWKEFPFTANGINFISKVDTTHPIYSRINSLPAGVFERMNIEAVKDLISKTYSLAEIQNELDGINAGGSYAFLELGVNA